MRPHGLPWLCALGLLLTACGEGPQSSSTGDAQTSAGTGSTAGQGGTGMGGAGGAGGGGIGGEGGGTGGAGGEGGGTGGAGGGTGGNAPGSVVIGVNTTPEELYVPGASLHLVIKVDGAVVQDKLFGTGIVEPIPLPQELKLVVGQGYSSFTPLENNGIADVYAGDQGMNISVEIMDKDGTKLTAEKPVTIATEPIY